MLNPVERIFPVKPVKAVEHDINRAFKREQEKGNKDYKEAFSKIYKAVKEEKKEEAKITDAYDLDLSLRATQSLFYRDMIDIGNIGAKIDEK